jgi:hypothetical protein
MFVAALFVLGYVAKKREEKINAEGLNDYLLLKA